MAYDKEIDYNFLTLDNNAKIANFSSQTKGCAAANVLSTDRKAIWLSETTLPQFLVIDIANFIKKPKNHFKYFGIYCWHAYSTNPKAIEIQFSKDNKNFLSFGKYEISLKPGTQFFEIKNNKLLEFQKFRFFKVIVKETYGGNRTYLNQVYLFDELSGMTDYCHNSKIADRKNLKNDSQSLIEIDEEEEILKAPIEMERSKIIMKNAIEEEKNNHSKILKNGINANNSKYSASANNFDLSEEEEDQVDQVGQVGQVDQVDNKKMKKIENILRNKNSKIQRKKEKEIMCINDSDSEYSDRQREREASLNLHEKSKKKLNKTFGFENDNKCNRIQNDIPINEYALLENQLKEMEDHLRFMEADVKVDNYKSYGGHSKSFSFIHPVKERERDTTHTTVFLHNTNNPFKQNKELNDYKDYGAIRTSSYQTYQKDYPSKLDNYIYNQEDKLNTNPNYNNNTLTHTNNNNFNTCNQNQIISNSSYNSQQQPQQYNSMLETKIQSIEDELVRFEGELSGLKNSFQKLLENINKLVDQSVLINPNQNMNTSFKNKSQDNELVNIILSECSKMINEKLMIRSNYNSNHNNKINSARSNPKRTSSNNLDENLSNLSSFEEKLNKKIEGKFDSLATNIESQIYNNFLKPSISTIERTMRTNFDDIKQRIQTIHNDLPAETNRHSNDIDSSINYENELKFNSVSKKLKETFKEKTLDNKLEEINNLGGRLYEKLLEKEKKLNELKNETSNYLKKKLHGGSVMTSSIESNLNSLKYK